MCVCCCGKQRASPPMRSRMVLACSLLARNAALVLWQLCVCVRERRNVGGAAGGRAAGRLVSELMYVI